MHKPIKKAIRTIALLTKRIRQVNFKSEQEIIEAHKLNSWSTYYFSKFRQARFDYYFKVFELKEGCVFCELSEKEAEQYSLIWKLVDLECAQYE